MIIHAWPWSLILLSIHVASGQECLQNYAVVEKALLDDPDNAISDS